MRTRLLYAAVACVALVATTGSSLFAQVSPGARIRVRFDTSPPRTLVGTVDSIWDNSLRMRSEDASKVVTVPLDAISTLELNTGRHSFGRTGAAVGSAVGLLTGVVVAVAANSHESCGSGAFSDLCDMTNIGRVFVYSGIGVLAGAGAGWLVGAQLHADTWAPVSVPRLQMAPVSLNGLGIAVAFRF